MNLLSFVAVQWLQLAKSFLVFRCYFLLTDERNMLVSVVHMKYVLLEASQVKQSSCVSLQSGTHESLGSNRLKAHKSETFHLRY